ncbi:MAG: hypothetical protein JO303_16945 [Caulobacteraceae bacterium]|nr:hypothetical protein [Caulobacteraceae bacterium]
MRVNTAKSIALGERIHKEFGSWAKARKTAVLRDGVYVLRSKSSDEPVEGQAKRKA